MRWSIVGVYDQPVMPSVWMSSITSSSSKRPSVHTERMPEIMNATAPMCRPDTWKSGYVTSWQIGPGGGASGSGGRDIALRAPWKNDIPIAAITLRWVLTAPFGRPVVPLV